MANGHFAAAFQQSSRHELADHPFKFDFHDPPANTARVSSRCDRPPAFKVWGERHCIQEVNGATIIPVTPTSHYTRQINQQTNCFVMTAFWLTLIILILFKLLINSLPSFLTSLNLVVRNCHPPHAPPLVRIVPTELGVQTSPSLITGPPASTATRRPLNHDNDTLSWHLITPQ